jgi:glycosyltransferase involved in cell wall biosynthesis
VQVPRVVLEGEFRSWASLAHINRELGARFAVDDTLDFVAVEHATPPDARVSLAPALAARMVAANDARVANADVRIWHAWPPSLERRPAKRYVLCQPWEFGELPVPWRDAIAAGIDGIWAYSTYVRDVYVRAGVAAEKLAIVPPGVDARVFAPDGAKTELPARGFRFLFLGGSTPRKGVDLAVNAFLAEFTRADDVTLVVKDASVLYPGNNVAEQIARVAAHPNVAHVHYTDRLIDAADLGAFYRSCDVLVAPYRGEGFGMPILEAMACGLPVIVTGGGSSDDFVDASVGIRIPATRRAFPPEDELPLVAEGWLLEPDLDALRAAMRRCFDDRALVRTLGAATVERARTWTWERSAGAAGEAIRRLCATG